MDAMIEAYQHRSKVILQLAEALLETVPTSYPYVAICRKVFTTIVHVHACACARAYEYVYLYVDVNVLAPCTY